MRAAWSTRYRARQRERGPHPEAREIAIKLSVRGASRCGGFVEKQHLGPAIRARANATRVARRPKAGHVRPRRSPLPLIEQRHRSSRRLVEPRRDQRKSTLSSTSCPMSPNLGKQPPPWRAAFRPLVRQPRNRSPPTTPRRTLAAACAGIAKSAVFSAAARSAHDSISPRASRSKCLQDLTPRRPSLTRLESLWQTVHTLRHRCAQS